MRTLVEKIDAILPQTQCGQCGYAACYPYAEAIATGVAEINQCPPRGDEGIRQLSKLLQKAIVPLNTKHGEHKPKMLAIIDEANCIGCALCIKACPVDAIIGAKHQMHSVLHWECTGCELCVAPCPVDCIRLEEAAMVHDSEWLAARGTQAAELARKRYRARLARLAQEEKAKAQKRANALKALHPTGR